MRKGVNKSQPKQRARTASQQLVRSLTKAFPDKKIPIAALTAISKKYKQRPLDPNSQFIKRLQTDPKHVSAPKLIEYISQDTYFQKGKQQLSDDAIKRSYEAFCNKQGRMTFQYILKKCEQLGVPMTERIAKGIVRKYGKGKQYLSVQDCTKVIHRRYAKGKGKQPQSPKKKSKSRQSVRR